MSEIEKNINRISKEQWLDGYTQGRADAIEKLEDAIINAFDDNNEKWTVISFLHKVHNIAQEQLKEQTE